MNRTSLSVIALAVGAVLIIGLYNVYKPQTKSMVDKVFNKVNTSLHHTHMGLKVHHYGGMNYTNDHGHIEITGGKLSRDVADKWNSNGTSQGMFASPDTPKSLKNATSLKISNLDVTGAHNLRYMLSWNSHLKSVDLSGLDTSSIASNNVNYNWGFSSMFQGDTNLEHVNLGSHFKVNNPSSPWAFDNMFEADTKMKPSGLTGNVAPQVQEAFNHRGDTWYPAN